MGLIIVYKFFFVFFDKWFYFYNLIFNFIYKVEWQILEMWNSIIKLKKFYTIYKIFLIPEKECINISIQNNNSDAIIKSDFNIEYHHKIFMPSFTIKDIIVFITISILI